MRIMRDPLLVYDRRDAVRGYSRLGYNSVRLSPFASRRQSHAAPTTIPSLVINEPPLARRISMRSPFSTSCAAETLRMVLLCRGRSSPPTLRVCPHPIRQMTAWSSATIDGSGIENSYDRRPSPRMSLQPAAAVELPNQRCHRCVERT